MNKSYNNYITTVDLYKKTQSGREYVAKLRVRVVEEHLCTLFYVNCNKNLNIMNKANASDYVRLNGVDYYLLMADNLKHSDCVVIYGSKVKQGKSKQLGK